MRFHAFVLISLILISGNARATDDMAPEGLWLTENEQAVISIEKCGGELCGYLHWIKDTQRMYDDRNPDPALHTRPLCGLKILSKFSNDPRNAKFWNDGEIYKSDEGDTYSGYIRVDSNDELYLRGYVGISLFGKSQIWTRVSETDYKACKKPK